MIYKVPTKAEYAPDVEAASEAFRRDLSQNLKCEPGVRCIAARPERCRWCASHRAAVWPRKDHS